MNRNNALIIALHSQIHHQEVENAPSQDDVSSAHTRGLLRVMYTFQVTVRSTLHHSIVL